MTDIRTLGPDEVITEPGFYAISLDRHHAQPCMDAETKRAVMAGEMSPPINQVSVTSGVLRKMELATPADVWAFHMLNPNAWPSEQTTALRLGRAMAAFVEGGMDAVAKDFRVLPKDKPNRPTDAQLRNYEERGAGDLSQFCLIPDDMPRKPSEAAVEAYGDGNLDARYVVVEDAPRKPTAKQIKAVEDGTATSAAIKSVEFWQGIEKDGRTPISQAEYDKIKASGDAVKKWRVVENETRTPMRQSEADQLIALKKRVEFWAKVDADTRDPLTDAEQQMIEDMGRVLADDPGACAAMGGIPEITMAWQDEETGLWLLSRPDTVNFDGTVTDYKKMATRGGAFNYRLVDSRITEHGYDMQLAFGAEVYERLAGDWPTMAAIVAQWDKAPHHVILREIAEEDLRMGQFRNRRAIRRFAECLTSSHWPGPGDDVGVYHRPQWQREMLLEEMQTEGTAP